MTQVCVMHSANADQNKEGLHLAAHRAQVKDLSFPQSQKTSPKKVYLALLKESPAG
jgi:hypothetical protein